jgi:hypothetical protein
MAFHMAHRPPETPDRVGVGPRLAVAIATYRDLCIDAVDDAAMQLFWAETLGLEPVPDDGGTLDLVGPTPSTGSGSTRCPSRSP